jgi:X-Pro dipeptidyl-peptidase-like protein
VVWSLRRSSSFACAAVLLAGAAGLTAPARVGAAVTCPSGLTESAHVTPDGGVPYTVCSGLVPSFDGAPLDSDVTIPDSATGALPLMVMLHGWGNSKTDFEATTLAGNGTNTYHWNNAWFAAQGWAVLNYTARGFHESCGKENGAPVYLTEAGCVGRSSWTHLADRRWEVHDTQYLAGLLVDDGVALPSSIAVTGDSYGGGQSWMLSLSDNQVMNTDGTLSAWTSPNGTALHLSAAVPQFTWTDLLQALTDNGRASDSIGVANGDHTSPLGVEKESYVDGLFALGGETAQYAPPQVDPTADLVSWYAGISAGEPYSADPMVAAAVQQIVQFRSPYYMTPPPLADAVPVFNPQGITDPLFPGIQSLQMTAKLPGYPIWTMYGDLGHAYAGNPPPLWQHVNDAANTWLGTVMAGGTPTLAHTTFATVDCVSGQSTTYLSGTSLAAMENGALRFSSTTVDATTSATGGGPEGLTVDPIANGGVPGTTAGCRSTSSGSDPGVARWTFSPASAATLLGSPRVSVKATLAGTDAAVATRLWDVDPVAGTQTLITRGVYRLTAALPGTTIDLGYELWPTAWQVQSGHQLALEITQVDSPTWRPDNLASAITYGCLSLTLPTA